MAKINIYFQDLNQNAKDEMWEEVRGELYSKIRETIESLPGKDPDGIANEIIDSYINEHNFANEFKI